MFQWSYRKRNNYSYVQNMQERIPQEWYISILFMQKPGEEKKPTHIQQVYSFLLFSYFV